MNNIYDYEIKDWQEIARDSQRVPEYDGRWLWMIVAGRGFGKTRTGAESIIQLINSGKYKRIGVIGKTLREIKDVMVEGVSGILSTSIARKLEHNTENNIRDPNIMKFRYYSSKNQIVWENGAKVYMIGGDNYQKLRGYQFDLIWIDEFAKYKYPNKLWEQVLFTLRLGEEPRCIITTTPKPSKLLKELSLADFTHLTKGSTFENKDNLSDVYINTMLKQFQGTHIGRQELDGEILAEVQNAVWSRKNIIYRNVDRENLNRVVIGVDPAVTSGDNSDETGIVIAGIGYDDKMYVLDDLSGKYKPSEWARIVCRACYDYKAGRIVAETNNGGDLVEEMLTTISPHIPFSKTRAIRGKISRAEPISLLYESNKVYHAREFPELEEQMCCLSYDEPPDKSPDRVDALVWAISELKEREVCNLSTIGY